MYVRTMERGAGHSVGNGLDKGRVDIVVDDVDKMLARDAPTRDTNNDKKSTNNQNITATATKTRTNNCNDSDNHKIGQATQLCWGRSCNRSKHKIYIYIDTYSSIFAVANAPAMVGVVC